MLDSKPPTVSVDEYMERETRFNMVGKMDPQAAKRFKEASRQQAKERYETYAYMARRHDADTPTH